jgi:hypothetical protein
MFANKDSIAIVILALIAAALMFGLGIDKMLAAQLASLGVVGAFFAGMFYTSAITTPFSMIVVLDLMKAEGPLLIAAFASLGGAIVDSAAYAIFRRQVQKNARKIMNVLRKKTTVLKPFFPLFGFVVFGTPLPDELGIALMQISSFKPWQLGAIVFTSKLVTLLALFYGLIN